jgi:hypothetical protein
MFQELAEHRIDLRIVGCIGTAELAVSPGCGNLGVGPLQNIISGSGCPDHEIG